MATDEKMLGDLFPGVDPRMRQDRAGNPMEQALAVGRDELTAPEIDSLVTKANVQVEFDNLPEATMQKVVKGMFGLWSFYRIGGSIEDGDQKIVGYNDTMKKIVESDQNAIRTNFHGLYSDRVSWGVRDLVLMASEENADQQLKHKSELMGLPEGYYGKLRYYGEDYKMRITVENDTEVRDKIESYLGKERQKDLQLMDRQLKIVGEVASGLTSISEK